MEKGLLFGLAAKIAWVSARVGFPRFLFGFPKFRRDLRTFFCLSAMALCAAPMASAAQLTVGWDDNSTDETGFKIERSTDGLLFVQIATVSAGVTSYVDTSVTARSYWYRVRAYNATSDSAYSNVAAYLYNDVALSITSQPASQSTTSGSNVSFTVVASGSPAPTYQWKKDGVAISGATSDTLTLNGVTTSSAATYTVVVTNSAGSATSNPATLTVTAPVATGTAPSFTTQPSNQSAVLGSNVTFTVAVSGSPTPTLQWSKDAVVISGATSATLTLNSVTSKDAGTYTVVATNASGSVTSKSAALTVSGVAPTIATQPVSQTVTAGGAASFSVTASGTPAPAYQWKKDGSAIAGATTATLALSSVTSANAGSYTVVVTNSVGSVTSSAASLTVAAAVSTGVAPTISSQPSSQSVAAGGSVSFSVTGTGAPSPSYQWRKDGVAISGGSTSTLNLIGVTSADAGSYTVVLTNSSGSVTSTAATLTVTSSVSSGVAPTISTQPTGQFVNIGATATFSVVATGTPAPTYQWKKDGVALSGATAATLTVSSVSSANTGTYTVVVTNTAGSIVSNGAVLALAASTPVVSDPATKTPGKVPSRLVNASIRAIGGQGDQTLIVGFVVGQASKSVLIRAVGPSLSKFTSAATFADPRVTIFDGSKPFASNDNWGGASDVRSAFAQTGAFDLAADSKDAALLTKLGPKAYTVQVDGTGAGMALAEIYDMDSSGGRLVNIAARAKVGSGDSVLIAGFVIAGDSPKQVLIRATGPALESFGVSGVLSAPQLTLYHGSTVVAQNEAWGGTDTLVNAFNATGAFPLSDPKSKDTALLVTLEPGAYSAIVSGVNGSTGVALVEVYEMP